MRKFLFTIILISTFSVSFSQIKPNERLVYAASYNMSGLMTQLAQVTMETETIQIVD